MKNQIRYGSLAYLSMGLSLALALPSLSSAQDDGDDSWVIVHAGIAACRARRTGRERKDHRHPERHH